MDEKRGDMRAGGGREGGIDGRGRSETEPKEKGVSVGGGNKKGINYKTGPVTEIQFKRYIPNLLKQNV